MQNHKQSGKIQKSNLASNDFTSKFKNLISFIFLFFLKKPYDLPLFYLNYLNLQVPMFSGNSLVELLPMDNVEHKVSIEIDFKANSLEGLLLYSQQGSVIGDG
jgi:hypothetical protein